MAERMQADELAGQRALATLDEMAAAWAAEVDLTQSVATIMSAQDAESRIEALVRQAWVEGAWTGATRERPNRQARAIAAYEAYRRHFGMNHIPISTIGLAAWLAAVDASDTVQPTHD